MNIVKLLTNKWEFDCNWSLDEVLVKVSNAKKENSLLELDRWTIDSLYRWEKCKDSQRIFLDLSVVEIYWYTTHNVEVIKEAKEKKVLSKK